jgi:hypothetical protein
MIQVLTPSALKADAGRVLDKAIKWPQYVVRNGVLLVITKADLKDSPSALLPWELRACALDSFYAPDKAW